MTSLVLAQGLQNRRNLVHAHEWFNRTDPTVPRQIGTVFLLIALAVIVGWTINRLQARAKEPVRAHPMRLYLRMQRRLGLSLPDRWRLWRLARALDLPHPTALLISAAAFDEAIERMRRRKGRGGRPVAVRAYTSIRSRLFPA